MSETMHTIYINNLNEKVKLKNLKKALNAVFAQFGEIVEIIAGKNMKMHGQAFVAFKDHTCAGLALKSMQGFPFYDKPMRIQYAKKEADCIAKLKGTYIERPKITKLEAKKKPKKKGISTASPSVSFPPSFQNNPSSLQNNPPPSIQNNPPPSFQNNPPPQLLGVLPGVPPGAMVKRLVPNVLSYNAIPPAPVKVKIEPNNILFVTNLPQETTQLMLNVLFQGFQGFKEVRLVPGRSDIAFVEYEDERIATNAKTLLQGFRLTPTNPICIEYANKG